MRPALLILRLEASFPQPWILALKPAYKRPCSETPLPHRDEVLRLSDEPSLTHPKAEDPALP